MSHEVNRLSSIPVTYMMLVELIGTGITDQLEYMTPEICFRAQVLKSIKEVGRQTGFPVSNCLRSQI